MLSAAKHLGSRSRSNEGGEVFPCAQDDIVAISLD